MSFASSHRLAVLLTMLMLAPGLVLLSASTPLAEAEPTFPTVVEGLPTLYCDESICPITERSPTVPDGAEVTEEPGWWLRYYPDRDSNGFDDRLQYVLSGEFQSESPSAIIGADGELTVAINVDYAWNPRVQEVDQLMAVLEEHGWIGEEGGAKLFHHHWVDSIALDKVPQSALLDIYHLPGVVMLEQQNVLAPTLAVATPSIKATSSSVYTTSAHMLGYRGDGVVIAIIDSGVDNEHRSLNDFDDVDDDPDSDASTYSDGKYLGGYDATNAANNTDGTDDPDDTAGHGTHVAGIAIGTGGPTRVNVGVAPGAYLIDVRAFQDIGNANAQDTQDAISWVIDNRNTNWGNNASSNGIDIMSMSFGRVRSLIGGADQGDSGTQTEARLVNTAFEQGIVPVCAMGNDGANYVSSPASADHCIAVAALDDMDTINRENDEVSSYSNYGPRLDDDDGDSWDELKPDVIAPGSGINAPRAQESSIGGIGGGQLADDDYVEKDGTSMSTPMVSGLCALILQANPGFSPADVKRALHDYSDFLPELSQQGSYQGNSWNASEGFGRVDAAASLQIRSGNWVNLTQPMNETWMDVDQTYRIRGTAEMLAEDVVVLNGTVSELSHVTISGRYTYWEKTNDVWHFRNKTAFLWDNATGIDNWTYDLSPELWRDGAGLYIEARAWDTVGRVSDASWGDYHLGETWMTLDEPSGFASLSGDATLIGEYKAVNSDQVQYKVGSDGEWKTADNSLEYPYVCDQNQAPNTGSSDRDCSSEEWWGTWDTTEYIDGGWTLYVRILSDSGESITPIERYVNIDNIPAAPELSPVGDITVEENGIEIDEATIDSFLNVRFNIRNNGDQHARNVVANLFENDIQIASETLPRIESTEVVEVVFGYHPTLSGDRELKVVIDPPNSIAESNEANNEQTLIFPINSVPIGVDLALREGVAMTSPRVANPNGDVSLNVRLENLGATDANGATFILEGWSELGWDLLDTRVINVVPGGGYTDIPFTLHEGQFEPGEVRFRVSASLDGVTDLNIANNQLGFSVVFDEIQLQGARKLSLSEGHEPLGFFGVSGENLLFTGDGESIWVHRVNEKYELYTCLELEDEWAGEFSIAPGEGDSAHLVWTRRLIDQFGATVTTLSYSTVDLSCTNTAVFDLMPNQMLAEGSYWGIDLDVEEGNALIGGYHRDLFTGGTYDDVTSIFLLDSATPLDRESWRLTREVIPDIVPPVGMVGSVQVAHGDDWTHIMYHAMRDDSTGSERIGMFYAHGDLGQMNWTFKSVIGDETALGELSVLQDHNGDDVVIAGWREGAGYQSELVLIRSDSSMQETNLVRVPAPGLLALSFVETERGIQMFHDSVGPWGRQIHYSMIDEENTQIGSPMAEGALVMAGRSDSVGETHLFYISATLDWRARMLIDDSEANLNDRGIIDTIRLWTGLDERTFDLAWRMALAISAMGCILLLATSAGVLSRRRRRGEALTVVVEEDEDEPEEVLDIDEDSVRSVTEPEEEPDLVVVVEEPEPEDEEPEDGRSRRRSRRKKRSPKEVEVELEELPEPPPPIQDEELPPPLGPAELGLLPAPPGMDVTCECGATFKLKSIEITSVKCPVCDTKMTF